MKKVLHIISSPQTETSSSRKLGNAVVEKILEKYPDSVIQEYDLIKNKIPHLDEIHINSFFTPSTKRTLEQQIAIKHSDEAIAALQDSDIIVIDAPMYNFTITSTLKAYFDSIARAGITFQYTGNGFLPEGLLKGKTAYISTSSGGIYSEGSLQPFDYAATYVSFFLELIGIKVAGIFRAEGQAIIGQEKALQKGIESIVVE